MGYAVLCINLLRHSKSLKQALEFGSCVEKRTGHMAIPLLKLGIPSVVQTISGDHAVGENIYAKSDTNTNLHQCK